MKRKHVRCSILRIGLFLFAVIAAPLRADEASLRFHWDQANASMAAARTPADFLETARIYNQLVAEGTRNGPLFSTSARPCSLPATARTPRLRFAGRNAILAAHRISA